MAEKIFIDDFLSDPLVKKEGNDIKKAIKDIIGSYEQKGWSHSAILNRGRLDLFVCSPEGNKWGGARLKAESCNGKGPDYVDAFRLFSALYWDLGGREFVNLPLGFYSLKNC